MALLITVAASAAVSGCVSVRAPASPDHRAPAAASSPNGAPRAQREAEPQIVQAPAREALELIEPAGDGRVREEQVREERTTASSPAKGRAPYGAGTRGAEGRGEHGAGARGDVTSKGNNGADGGSRATGGTGSGHASPGSRPARPPSAAPAAGPDVCGLGEQYGDWDPNSPQARICRDTYGS
ncbi:hypothetical protein [Streptomyces sp. NBC_01304]|uniref:hypothetical protein n=1 Tax=Streptomyces sp. NBC_01304 TaxID=2903818 RepID=UPI002E1138AD|nr:hypothetical protein OG430_40635 [Streptomyces sp. NBC_01304]